MTFRSRCDLWLKIIFAVTNVMLAGAIVLLFMDGKLSSIFVGLVTLAILAGTLWMQLATEYRIDDDHLFVRSGPLHWTIPIASILAMTPTDDPTAGPALSLDRVRVEFMKNGAKDEILISPHDRDGFIREWRSRATAR